MEHENNKKQRNCRNLSRKEELALEDLRARNDIVICKADKGGAMVIMEVGDYIKEAERQLTDRTFYKKVQENPTSLYAALLKTLSTG